MIYVREVLRVVLRAIVSQRNQTLNLTAERRF